MQDTRAKGIFKSGAILIAREINRAYVRILKILPNRNIHISFKSSNFAVRIPID